MEVVNETPFAADRCVVVDRDGRDLVVAVAKATYRYGDRSILEVADEQRPVQWEDSYSGDAGLSSITYASDFSFGKPGTDVVLVGHAYPPRYGATSVDVGVQVGSLRKLVRVFGDRYWASRLGVAVVSDAAPFDRIPLVYERSFGGNDTSHPDEDAHEAEVRNPVGVGFRAKKSKKEVFDTPLPNIEDPKNLISGPNDRPSPAGFGFVGPHWEPRLSFAGTYDDAWDKNRKPLLPVDFDSRYFSTAPADLTSAEPLKGNEQVQAVGVSMSGRVDLWLPAKTPTCSVADRELGLVDVPVKLDRIVLEPDNRTVVLLWSGSLRVSGRITDIEAVRFQLSK